ncbi:alpha/beta fold hydrolase [Pseudoflavitalea sp. X16]|uniref:alpha/beta hydrolase n=1 Tax=Paraflavitalea devenefica TaxID=2716334 RepID=UPI00141D7561|nr:alpha/beta fold hydrolase [Paraflavitalea devenefica]NII29145.1 alpha/beta fold hydrolase [Paraflavitalea devenefica]
MKFAQQLVVNYLRARLNMISLVSPRRAAVKAFELFCTPLRRSRKQPPAIFDQGEALSFTLEGITIRGHRWNHPQPRKALIVHGFESSSKNFDRYITPLIRKGYEVLAFDAPAHGNSGGKQINLPLYVRTLQEINQRYGPIQSFMAHSFGGLALVHFIETIPHTADTRVALIAPATETTSAIDSFFRFLDLRPTVRTAFDQLIFDLSGVWPAHFSIRRAMQQVQAQVLWLHDEQDELTPLADALKVRDDQHPQVSFVITQGLGHRAIYRDNKVVKQVIEFL